MNPAEASARAVDELTDEALPGLPLTDVDRVESLILADCAEAEATIQRLIAQADAYGRRVAELEAQLEGTALDAMLDATLTEEVERTMTQHWDLAACPCLLCRVGRAIGCRPREMYLSHRRESR